VDDVSVSLEHVDLLNSLDGLDIELLERCLQLLVVHPRALVYLLDLSSRCALSTIAGMSAFLCFVHFVSKPNIWREKDRVRRNRGINI
jgi:hypothetical protein